MIAPHRIGYALSSEEHAPLDLIRNACRAEKEGFEFALISDHFHPWLDRQGQSPFVWSVLGGIAAETERLRIGTGVTCPLIRMHPTIVAHAAATTASMLPGRFFLGLGTGERLNEHIHGDRWPPARARREMLEEAVAVMRELWDEGLVTHYGRYYRVENARLYTLPDEPIEVLVAAGGTRSAALAGRIADGMVGTAPVAENVESFVDAGGGGKPRFGQLTVCVAPTRAEGLATALEWWPNSGLQGPLSQELSLPSDFEQAVGMVTAESLAERVVCGSDAADHVQAIEAFEAAGFDHVYVHQVGPDQELFFDFYRAEVIPELARRPVSVER